MGKLWQRGVSRLRTDEKKKKSGLFSPTTGRKLPGTAKDISYKGTMSYLLGKLWTRMLVLELFPVSIIQTVPAFPSRPCLTASKGVVTLPGHTKLADHAPLPPATIRWHLCQDLQTHFTKTEFASEQLN